MQANFRYILDTDIRPSTPIKECRLYRKELLSGKSLVFRITVPNDADILHCGDHEQINLHTPLSKLSPTILVRINGGWRSYSPITYAWLIRGLNIAAIPKLMEDKGYVLTDNQYITKKQYAYLMNHYETLKDTKTLPCDRDIDKLTKEGA